MNQFPSPFNSPNLRPDLPNYPVHDQLIRVTATRVIGPSGSLGSSSAGQVIFPYLYVGSVQQMHPTSLLPRDREPCLVSDIRARYNSSNIGEYQALSPGFYLGRLASNFNGLPVYEVCEWWRPTTGSNIDVFEISHYPDRINTNLLAFRQQDGFFVSEDPGANTIAVVGMYQTVGVSASSGGGTGGTTAAIVFNGEDGFTVSTGSLSGGSDYPYYLSVGVNIQDASVTQKGKVNISTQTFGGDKYFRDLIISNQSNGDSTTISWQPNGYTGEYTNITHSLTGRYIETASFFTAVNCSTNYRMTGLATPISDAAEFSIRGIRAPATLSTVYGARYGVWDRTNTLRSGGTIDSTASGGLTFTGGIYIDGVVNLAYIVYTAGNNADWAGSSPPTTIPAALDRIAAALTAAGFPP